MEQSHLLIIGAGGQLSRALQDYYPSAKAIGSHELDISDRTAVEGFDWNTICVIVNTAAYTNVDEAETPTGRRSAWSVNSTGAANLARVAARHNIVLVHISTDYVFDGSIEQHTEAELLSPLGVYGQSKAAADVAVSLIDQHYIIRTSWVVGSGKNFVRAIAGLAAKHISPQVVADQYGRLTFTRELCRAIDHLLLTLPPFGVYNVSNSGDIASWADIARSVYRELGRTDLQVGDTTAKEYYNGKVSSPRPTYSGLDLSKIQATNFTPTDWRDDLKQYIKEELLAS